MTDISFIKQPCPFTAGMNVVAYARDSGGEEQERSVDQQIDVYREYCKQNNLILTEIFADRARPGSTTVGREGFERMISLLRSPNSNQGVLLWKINRFARNLNESQFFKADLRRRGYVLFFIADDIPNFGDITPVFEAFLEWKAQRDLKDISTDSKRGLASLVMMKKDDGSYEGFSPGTPPVGFKRESVRIGTKRNGEPRIVSRWIPDPEIWDRVKLAWQMRAEGHSLESIHKATSLYNSKGCYSTFFANELYRGVFVFGDLRLEGFVPAACTPEQWNVVQKLRRPRPVRGAEWEKQHPRRASSPYLVSGLIFCSHCGKPMVGGKAGKNRWRHYICSKKERDGSCDSTRLSAERIEQTVIDFIRDGILTAENLLTLWNRWHAAHEASAEALQAEMEGLRKRLSGVNRAIENILNTIEEEGSSPALKTRRDKREAEKAEIERAIHHLQTQSKMADAEPPSTERLEELAEKLRDKLLDGDIEKSKPVIRAFIIKIEASEEGGRVTYTLPSSSVMGYTRDIENAPLGAPSQFRVRRFSFNGSNPHALHEFDQSNPKPKHARSNRIYDHTRSGSNPWVYRSIG